MKKFCTICEAEKELDAFYKSVSCKGGYRTECKECHNVRRVKYGPYPKDLKEPKIEPVKVIPISDEFECICGKTHHCVEHGISTRHYPHQWSESVTLL